MTKWFHFMLQYCNKTGLKNLWQKLQTEKALVMNIVTVIIVTTLMALVLSTYVQGVNVSTEQIHQSHKSTAILAEIQNVDTEIQALSDMNKGSSGFQNSITKLNADLLQLQQAVTDTAKTSDVTKVSGQINSMQSDMDNQMLDIKKAVAGDGTKQYLSEDVLPFQVIAIDVISQQPFVSVNYQNHITPLAIGDALAGWKVATADYDSETAELVNDRGQYVKVIVQG
jgi:uncharacterized protein YukE